MRALVRADIEVGNTYIRTPTFLLKALAQFVLPSKVNSNAWPQTPHSLSKRLKKMEPALRACGIGIAFHHSGNRTVSVTRLASGRARADLAARVASQLPLDCLLPVFCVILGGGWGDRESAASGRYRARPAPDAPKPAGPSTVGCADFAV